MQRHDDSQDGAQGCKRPLGNIDLAMSTAVQGACDMEESCDSMSSDAKRTRRDVTMQYAVGEALCEETATELQGQAASGPSDVQLRRDSKAVELQDRHLDKAAEPGEGLGRPRLDATQPQGITTSQEQGERAQPRPSHDAPRPSEGEALHQGDRVRVTLPEACAPPAITLCPPSLLEACAPLPALGTMCNRTEHRARVL